MSVLDRASLEASPLADLHTIASELSLDGYRRLRKADLIDRIIARQDGVEIANDEPEIPTEPEAVSTEANGSEESGSEENGSEEGSAAARRRRGRRGGRGRGAAREGADDGDSTDAEPEPKTKPASSSDDDGDSRPARSSRRRSGAKAPAAEPEDEPAREADEEEAAVEGVVELLANGSGFVRVSPPDPTDDDVYISAAQVKRCELVSGDRVAGPKRAPRRSERFASLVRIDTINGRPASELADGARYDDLPAAFPTERFRLGSDDPTLKAVEFLTPFGRGSRVIISGAARSGKSHTLRQLADALSGDENTHLFLALAGVRPEEISEWASGAVPAAGALSFAASSDAQDHVVELVVDQARRLAARGAHAVVLIDTLDGLNRATARKVLAAARNIVDGGSLTVIATSSAPLGGETTVIALDSALTAAGRYPALDLPLSGSIRAELLVGEEAVEAIVAARAEAAGAQ
jgi:transcription termination factor Rho